MPNIFLHNTLVAGHNVPEMRNNRTWKNILNISWNIEWPLWQHSAPFYVSLVWLHHHSQFVSEKERSTFWNHLGYRVCISLYQDFLNLCLSNFMNNLESWFWQQNIYNVHKKLYKSYKKIRQLLAIWERGCNRWVL